MFLFALLPAKNDTMLESASVVQTHSNRSNNKNVHNSHGCLMKLFKIIPKIVILRLRILNELDRQPSKIRNLGKGKVR